MYYRTRLYLAAEWDGDRELIDQLYYWNDSEYYLLEFSNAHDLMQSYDWSMACSIKRSLAERMSGSKIFLLIVGDKTNTVTKGSCRYCRNYYSTLQCCLKDYSVDYRSFIQYECEKAKKDNLNIIVLYNGDYVDKDKCPLCLRDIGNHLAAYHYEGYSKKWNYQQIRSAIENAK